MLDPKTYVEQSLIQLDKYITNILEQPSSVGRLEYLSVIRFNRLKDKYTYDEHSVTRVIKFFSLLNLPVKNEVKQIQLLPFQLFWIANIYGLIDDNGNRLFNECYIEIAKKNGKTSFFAGLAIYEALADGELNANCLLVGSSREQARVALSYIINIIENSPGISNQFTVNKNIIFQKTKTELNKIEVRASDAGKIQGLNTSFSLIDEYAFHNNSDLKDKIKSGMIARKNHLQIAITTASNNRLSPAYESRQSAVNVLEEIITNDSLFIQIFTLDSKEEITNPKSWSKANPSLGLIFDLEDLVKEYESAKHISSKLNTFITDNLNVWIEDLTAKWIEDDIIKDLLKDNKQIEDGSEVYIGYDGSATRDLTSISITFFNNKTQEFITNVIYIFPDNPSKMIKQGSVNLSQWIEEGYIIQNPLTVIDDDFIIDIFKGLDKKYKIISVGYDAFNSRGLFQKLERETGIPVNIVSQKMTNLNYPIRFLESLIHKHKIFFNRNPVTRWNFQNVVPYYDPSNLIKLDKRKSESIDGVIATACAIHEWLAFNESSFTFMLDQLKTVYQTEKK